MNIISEKLENIRNYLDVEVHPVVSPDRWNVYAALCDMVDDIITLLKTQEPRVMSLEELKALPDESDVWLEEFCSTVVAATVSHQMDIYKVLKRYTQNATYFYGIEQADYNGEEYMDADYGKEWRCWTSRPDEKRRAETPWE